MIHGINIHKIYPWETWMYSAITELVIDFVRVDLNWNEIEFERGKWNPDFENMINTFTAKNVQMFGTLAYTPSWLSDNHRNPPPISEWEKFIITICNYYKGSKLKYLGIWNEPDLKDFWTGTIEQYIELVKLTSDILRDNHFECVGPETSNVGIGNEYLERVLREVADKFDIISIHQYRSTAGRTWDNVTGYDKKILCIKSHINGQKEIIRKYSDKPIWLTEFGFEAGEQAPIELKSFYEKSDNQIDATFLYHLRDFDTTSKQFGLMESTKYLHRNTYDIFKNRYGY